MLEKFDTIKLKILKSEEIKTPWLSYNCCQILINNIDLLDIIRKAELPYFSDNPKSAGAYTYMLISELYNELIVSKSKRANVLCCCCGEVECAATSVQILKTNKSVIWNNFKTIRDWEFDLSYEFKLEEYNNFLALLEQAADN